jgi:hypothetical protein
MKKFMSVSLIGLVILAFGAIVYAQEAPKFAAGFLPGLEIKATGWIDAQTFLMRNVTAGANGLTNQALYNAWGLSGSFTGGNPSGDLDRKVSFWESRTRFTFNWIYGKATSGTIQFEADAGPWGGTPGGNAGQISERNTYGTTVTSADRAALEIKSVYFDFATPYLGVPVPMNFRVGLQPLTLRYPLLLLTDGIGIKGTFKVDPATIEAWYAKYLEGQNRAADDVDMYGLHVNTAIDKLTVGGYFLYYNMNTYPFLVGQPLSTMAGWPAALSRNAFGTQSADFWWLGLYADGRVGPVNINFDFMYDNGKVKSRISDVSDVKYSGYATRLVVDFPWEQFNFGIGGAYGSGADTKKTSGSGLAGSATFDGDDSHKVGAFVVPPSTEAAAGFGESLVLFSWWGTRGDSGIGNTLNYNQVCKGPLGGLWYAKVYGKVKPVPWYTITLTGFYIGDTTKHGNTFGNAHDANDELRNDKKIGWEADLVQEIEIYKNLKFAIGAGYLWSGSAMDLWNGLDANYSPKNPWNISSNMTYFF